MRLTIKLGNLLLAVLLLLGACTAQRIAKYPDKDAWQLGRSELLAIRDWSFHGKLAVRSDQDHANLKVAWTQHGENFDLILTGPLGRVLARVRGDENEVIFLIAGREPIVSKDGESVIYENWGWQLPVSQMPYWVRGIPAPDLSYQANHDSAGVLRQLRQRGWEVRYLRYKEQMPVRLELNRRDVDLLLVVKEWHLPASSNNPSGVR